MRIGIGHADPDPDAERLAPAARALADALLGAAGLDGGEAPASRPGEPDTPGGHAALDLLSRAVRAVEGENYQVVNVDLTVIGAAPGGPEGDGDAPGRRATRSELADRLHVSPEHVSLESAAGGVPAGSDGRSGVVTAVALVDRIAPMDQVHSPLRAGG